MSELQIKLPNSFPKYHGHFYLVVYQKLFNAGFDGFRFCSFMWELRPAAHIQATYIHKN